MDSSIKVGHFHKTSRLRAWSCFTHVFICFLTPKTTALIICSNLWSFSLEDLLVFFHHRGLVGLWNESMCFYSRSLVKDGCHLALSLPQIFQILSVSPSRFPVSLTFYLKICLSLSVHFHEELQSFPLLTLAFVHIQPFELG